MSMTVFTTLETTRLRLRHLMDSDLALFMAYRNDPEVARYQGWEGISEPEARAFLQEQKEVQPGVPGQWFQIAVELKETGMLVGWSRLPIVRMSPLSHYLSASVCAAQGIFARTCG
jgi:RimJ/RimL family protein N-acetyltransferase